MPTATDLAAELDAVEAAFGAEPLPETARRLQALAPRMEDADGPMRARWLVDLGVVAHGSGEPASALSHMEAALVADPTCLDAIENLAEIAGAHGDPRQALGARLRAAGLRRDDADRWLAVAVAANACGEWPLARRAADRVRAVDPERAGLAVLDVELAMRPSERPVPRRRGRLMIAVEHFFPSSGGSERLAEDAGVALRELGWEVAVVTGRHPDRVSCRHRGLAILEVGHKREATDFAALVEQHAPDAILSFAGPLAWPIMAPLVLPHPRPRAVVVPCVNRDWDATLRRTPMLLRRYHALLAGAGAVGHSSLHSYDARMAAELDLPPTYVPNAVIAADPDPSVLGRVGLAPGDPFLLVVGNMWPEKNHVGLLEHLARHDDDVPLVHVGTPSLLHPGLAEEISAAAGRDPRVRLFGAGSREEVAGLMRGASALLLPSLAEATPLVVLEAMSHGLPWIATPHCGAVHEHAGGRIVDLDAFLPTVRELLADEPARRALGEAGRAHWSACYTWDAIAPRYDALLRGESELPPLVAPEPATPAVAAA
ncbi:MAG TPA: glycosyltransferase family 4 protein [Baekduia sp.]|uniref:glycosyltransferase family 4 protein n=1 Tax=Baekduia sp. TaxID=2600305 RepID=UPI002D799302|nr:glycosyltransferase family 4 protein [Baekduia sp.]HET6508902.1 glycosyltransferase family 4 protein [Baekduia sp.]